MSANRAEQHAELQIPMINAEAETVVIGYLMNYSLSETERWLARLDADCFKVPKLRAAYLAICQLVEQRQEPNVVFVYQELQRLEEHRDIAGHDLPGYGIQAWELMEWAQAARTEDVSMLVEVLRDYKVRRSLQLLALKIETGARDTRCNIAELVNLCIRQLDVMDVARMEQTKALAEICPEVRQRIDDNLNPDSLHHGPYIGLDEIDSAGGLPETGLVVLAGGTSSGKSSVAAGILLHSADKGMKGTYISLEMTNRSLVSRMTAMGGSGLSGRDLLTRPLTDLTELMQAQEDLQRLEQRYGQMIYFNDNRSSNLDDICAAIHDMVHNQGIRVAVVDFIQLLNFTMQGRTQVTTEQLMGQASRTLKNLADRLGICIVMLSQLNRTADRQRPSLGGVRDSGQIAEAADMVILTWRPEQYQGSYDLNLAKYSPKHTMAVLVAKNREGALADILAYWDGPRTLMRQLTCLELAEVERGPEGEGVFG